MVKHFIRKVSNSYRQHTHLSKKGTNKVDKVMKEFGKHHLHSGSKHGPLVTSRKQAIAIALSEAHHAMKKH